MKSWMLVGIGGFVGSVARYLVSIAAPARLAGVPLPTLLVNVAGSLAAGALLAVGESRLDSGLWRFLVVGGLGGFTTFSAFSAEALTLAKAGDSGALFATILANVVLGISAAWLGFTLARN